MKLRVQPRDLPVAPAAATAAVVVAGVLTLAGLLPALIMVAVAALLVGLLWRDRRIRVELVAQVEQDAAQSNLVTAASEQWYRALVRHSYDLTMVLAADGTIRFVSPSVRSLFGYDPTALTGRQLSTLLSDEDVIRVHEVLERALREPNVPLTIDAPLWHAEGRWVATESAVTNLLGDPHVSGIVLNTRDVSDRQQLQNQLVHQAFHDPLTGLANRTLFRQKVEQALIAAAGHPDRVAVLFLDLDGFKAVNDVQGHAVGDELLRHVAARLLRCVRGDSCVARLGGDEFAVLLTGTEIGGQRGRGRAPDHRIPRCSRAGRRRARTRPQQHRHRRSGGGRRRGSPATQRRSGDVPRQGCPRGWLGPIPVIDARRRPGARGARARACAAP